MHNPHSYGTFVLYPHAGLPTVVHVYQLRCLHFAVTEEVSPTKNKYCSRPACNIWHNLHAWVAKHALKYSDLYILRNRWMMFMQAANVHILVHTLHRFATSRDYMYNIVLYSMYTHHTRPCLPCVRIAILQVCRCRFAFPWVVMTQVWCRPQYHRTIRLL